MSFLIERLATVARSVSLFGASVLLFATTAVDAQPVDPNYQWTLQPVSGEASVILGLDSSAAPPGEVVAGWAVGVCHDTALLDPVSAVSGATALIVSGGSPPDFEQINVIANGSAGLQAGQTPGCNQGVVIDFLGMLTLPPGSGYQLLECTYVELGTGTAELSTCDTTPGGISTIDSIVVILGQSIAPLGTEATMVLPVGAPAYELYFSDPVTATTEVSVTTLFDVAAGVPEVAGWTYGICHDPASLNPTAAVSGATTVVVNGGSPPDFEQINLIDNGAAVTPPDTVGVNQGVVINFLGAERLGAGSEYELLEVTYQAIDVGTSVLVYCETTPGGAFPVDVVISQAFGNSVDPALGQATVVVDSLLPSFVRGDCDVNDTLDLSDIVFELEYLFTNGAAPTCQDACDVNDDGELDLADPITLISFLFFGGTAPPEPTTCGEDPTDDALTCDEYSGCP